MALICVDNSNGYGFVVNRGDLGGLRSSATATSFEYEFVAMNGGQCKCILSNVVIIVIFDILFTEWCRWEKNGNGLGQQIRKTLAAIYVAGIIVG
eukprot:scaffold16857_cov72-Skeletonema_dohrnii-CCMP3373.AAC.1